MRRNKIKNVKIGQILTIQDDADFDKKGTVERKYNVIAIYPFHVLGINKNGIKRSFSYCQLVQLGYEKQSLELEALKSEKEHLHLSI